LQPYREAFVPFVVKPGDNAVVRHDGPFVQTQLPVTRKA
jgi:hypothetical protein